MRGATVDPNKMAWDWWISIHAPHAGCDQNSGLKSSEKKQFQSTHPMRGATELRAEKLGEEAISIHAPHAGCDLILP